MEGTISCEEFLSEVLSDGWFRDNHHLVDSASVYRWIAIALRKFGQNIMQKEETMIKVENHRAELPLNFGNLSLAVLCDPYGYKVNKDKKDHFIKSYMWKERIESNCLEPNECVDSCPEMEKERVITERYYFRDEDEDDYAEIFYRNPVYLKLGKNILKNRCTDDCANKYSFDPNYRIDIINQTAQTNFREGTIYMVYYALPADEEGLPIIPKTFNRTIENYLEYHVKRRILEDAIMSDDAPNKVQLLSYYRENERATLSEALKELSPLKLDSLWHTVNKLRSDMNRFDIRMPKPLHIKSNIVGTPTRTSRQRNYPRYRRRNY